LRNRCHLEALVRRSSCANWCRAAAPTASGEYVPLDVLGGDRGASACLRPVLVDVAQGGDSAWQVRLRPPHRRVVVEVGLAHGHEIVTNQLRRVRRQVVERSAERRRHDRRAVRGGIEQRIAPAFAAVHREIGVAAAPQRLELRVGPGLGANRHTRVRTYSGPRRRHRLLRGLRRPRVGLDHQHRIADVAERLEIHGEHVSRPLALLPLEHAVDDEVAGIDRQRRLVWRHFAVPVPGVDDVRQLEDRRAQIALEDGHVEVAWQPQLDDVAERGAPLRRHPIGFPDRHADRVAKRKREAGPLRRDAVEEMEVAVGTPADGRFDELVAHLPVVLHQIDDRHLDPGRVQGVHVARAARP
jgi:hypothetical protein